MPLDDLDLLFIENVGNLFALPVLILGHHRNVVLLSVTEGDDKPANANVTPGTAPLTVQFTDTSTGSPDYWSWYSDRYRFSTNDPESHDWTHTYQTPGTYTVDLTVTNNAGSDTNQKVVSLLYSH